MIGAIIVYVGPVLVSIWLAPADLAPVVTCAVGLLVFLGGMGVVTNKVTCAGCARSHWIIGRPTRLSCAHCGTPFFAEAPAAGASV